MQVLVQPPLLLLLLLLLEELLPQSELVEHSFKSVQQSGDVAQVSHTPTQQDLQGSAIQLSTMFLSAWGTRTKYKKRVTRKIMPGRKLCFIDTVWVLDW